ncbi:MAG: hypothetical protein JXA94_00250 [Parachlamydiales bacterium]|nr:hypothetical protein [Parachlamydiales bacterium]
MYHLEERLIILIKEARIAQYRASFYQSFLRYLQKQLWPFKEELIQTLEKSIKEEIKRALENESRTLNFNRIPSKIN